MEPFLSNIEKFKINEFGIVPPIAIAIIMCGLTDRYSFTSMKAVSIGAAPLSRESQDRIRKLLPPGTFVNQVNQKFEEFF